MNRRIVGYMCRSAASDLDLTGDVQWWIDEGWQPVGGVTVGIHSGVYGTVKVFAQALVKYETPEQEETA